MSEALETSAPAAVSPAELAFPEPRNITWRDVFLLPLRAWPFIRPYRRHLVYLFLMMVPALPVGLFALILTRIVFDVVGHGNALSAGEARLLLLAISASREAVLDRVCIEAAVALLIGLPYVSFLFGYSVWILQRISNLFRVNLYTRLQELSLRFHAEEKIGDAIFRMFQDSAAIPDVISNMVIQPVRFVPFALANLIWLVLFDYRMALIAIALIPAYLVLMLIYTRPLRTGFIRERETAAIATTRIEETLASIKVVKVFGTESSECDLYARENWDYFLASRDARLRLARYRAWANGLRGLAYAGAGYFGARQVLAGGYGGLASAAVSLGLFQGSLAVLARTTARTREIVNLWASLQDVVIAISRVLEMTSKPADEQVGSGARIPPESARTLEFEHVGFGYDARTPVLDDISFRARVGEITALAGPSGSGKSTVIALAVRFFDPSNGHILLDGTPIKEFDLTAWRGLLSVALQENPLFSGTVRQNVAYGRADATDVQVNAAITRAGLSDFVASLPAGLDAVLGEKGAKISVGQAQRIGLARSLLRDASILLLDEPTASLDHATEESVMRGVRAWIAERPDRRMAIVATHRRSTAAKADCVYEISAGRIAAREREGAALAATGSA